ncbi:tyrosine-protein phosphatase [Alishewanella sp. d11]|uniref:tyrosine-protein phosphatase n=1 Tax=Alishewanella sp. d11 TaxID=3414030 RepID=UPI003BF8BAC9
MYDLHSHIIPGIDDGAATLQDALDLLKLAEAQGITHMVATPHIHAGYFDNTPELIQVGLAQLQRAASLAGIAVKIAAAAELRIGVEILPMLKNGTVPILGHYQQQPVILLEMPHSHLPAGYENILTFINKLGYRVMIAHPERNRDLLVNPDRIMQLQRFGCLFQLTAASIVGSMGEAAQQLAAYYLEKGYVTVIASDCHSVKRRPPLMAEAYDVLCRDYSPELAQQLCFTQPAAIAASLFTHEPAELAPSTLTDNVVAFRGKV